MKEKQAAALDILLRSVMEGEVPDIDGYKGWTKLLRHKFALAFGDVRVAREINGELIDIYRKAPDSASIDWLIQWIIGRQPEIVKVAGDAENPLWANELSDEQIKQRITAGIAAALSGIDKARDGAERKGGSDLSGPGGSIPVSEVCPVQAVGEDPPGSGGVPAADTGEAKSEPDKKDNRDPAVAPGTSQVDAGDDKLDAPADSPEPERPGVSDERKAGQRQEVSGSDQGAVRTE
jgi:hypothetical protein